MKKFDVEIVEVLTRTVTVEAESGFDAELLVEERWNNNENQCSVDEHFDHAEFHAKEASRDTATCNCTNV